jgi:hypothetical protein
MEKLTLNQHAMQRFFENREPAGLLVEIHKGSAKEQPKVYFKSVVRGQPEVDSPNFIAVTSRPRNNGLAWVEGAKAKELAVALRHPLGYKHWILKPVANDPDMASAGWMEAIYHPEEKEPSRHVSQLRVWHNRTYAKQVEQESVQFTSVEPTAAEDAAVALHQVSANLKDLVGAIGETYDFRDAFRDLTKAKELIEQALPKVQVIAFREAEIQRKIEAEEKAARRSSKSDGDRDQDEDQAPYIDVPEPKHKRVNAQIKDTATTARRPGAIDASPRTPVSKVNDNKAAARGHRRLKIFDMSA